MKGTDTSRIGNCGLWVVILVARSSCWCCKRHTGRASCSQWFFIYGWVCSEVFSLFCGLSVCGVVGYFPAILFSGKYMYKVFQTNLGEAVGVSVGRASTIVWLLAVSPGFQDKIKERKLLPIGRPDFLFPSRTPQHTGSGSTNLELTSCFLREFAHNR